MALKYVYSLDKDPNPNCTQVAKQGDEEAQVRGIR